MNSSAPIAPGRLQLIPPRPGEKNGTLVLVDAASNAPILAMELTPEALGLLLLGKGGADPSRPTSAKTSYSIRNLERIGRKRETRTEIVRVGLRAFNEAEIELAEAQASIDVSDSWQVLDPRELVARANQVRCDEQFSWQRVTLWRLRELMPANMTLNQSLLWLSELIRFGDEGARVRDFPPALIPILHAFLERRPEFEGETGDHLLERTDLLDFVSFLPKPWRDVYDSNF